MIEIIHDGSATKTIHQQDRKQKTRNLYPIYRISGGIPKGHKPYSSILTSDIGQYRFEMAVEFTAGSQKSASKKINLIKNEWSSYLMNTSIKIILERKEFRITMIELQDDEKDILTPDEIGERIRSRIHLLSRIGMRFEYPNVYHIVHKEAMMNYKDVVNLPDGLFKNKLKELKKLIESITKPQ